MTPRPLLFENARLVDPASGMDRQGSLLAVARRIAALDPDSIPDDAERVDCHGLVLAPGLVDIRVRVCEPGAPHKEDIASLGQAAVAGGVCSMVALPDANTVLDNVAGLQFIARRGRETRLAKLYAHGALTRGLAGAEITEFGLLRQAGAIAFTDGETARAGTAVLGRALAYARAFDCLLMQRPEDPGLAAHGVMNEGELATRLGLPGIPRAAEWLMLDRDLTLVGMTGGRYHAAALSTGPSLDRIRAARARGLDVTCDVTPPHFALNELAIADYRTFARLAPPLRCEADRQAMIAGLVDGTVDIVTSDHAPQDQDSKRLPFAQAETGGVGVETLLTLCLELWHNNKLSLVAALDKVTAAPARRFGLPAGTLATGAAADLVLFDPGAPWRIDADRLRSKSGNSPFDGRLVQGRVRRTVVDGRTVFTAD